MPIVELLTADNHKLLINVRRESTTLLVDDKLSLSYDREGRLIGAWQDGRNYRRSLDNRVLEKQEGTQPGLAHRVRRELPADEARAWLEKIYALAAQSAELLAAPSTRVTNAATPADLTLARDAFARILSCDWQRLVRDRETFHWIYRPVHILPPDQYLALVLQATEGCSHNHCAFCGFYRDRKFHIKSLAEFRQHIRDVRAFFGGAIGLRKSIFLADANALVMPQEQLVPLFDAINQEFVIPPCGVRDDALRAWQAEHPIHFDGVFSFVDAFTTRRKTAREFADLCQRGLRRVYVGLETGDPELLRFLGKPNTPNDVVQLVDHIKAGGVAVGIIVLAGAGGEKYAAQHVRHTVATLNQMPLDERDLIYFSELVDFPGSDYSALARDANIRPLRVAEIEHQMTQMRAGLYFPDLMRAPKISYYDIREFLY